MVSDASGKTQPRTSDAWLWKWWGTGVLPQGFGVLHADWRIRRHALDRRYLYWWLMGTSEQYKLSHTLPRKRQFEPELPANSQRLHGLADLVPVQPVFCALEP